MKMALTAVLAVACGLSADAGWQERIDVVASCGGGRVTVPPGRHVTGCLMLRSNVELHLEKGAVLEGSPTTNDYPRVVLPNSEGEWMAVVMALGATNVAVTGEGEIFGNGTAFPQPANYGNLQEGWRPRGLFFADCRNVRLAGFRLRDTGSWGCVFKCCEDVEIRRLSIDNHANANNDGIDLEARNVVISDCDVDSGDDAICIKSNDPDFIVENVLVTNVTARSNCACFKLGTASHGTMQNILFVDCHADAPRRDFRDRRGGNADKPADSGWFTSRWRSGIFPPTRPDQLVSLNALAVECVDGGRVENITFRNVTVDGTVVPIFVRGGMRKGRSTGTPPGDQHILRNILFENVSGRSLSSVPSSVTGLPDFRVRNVTLRNVTLTVPGGGETEAERTRPVPEYAGRCPGTVMFEQLLPAYGLWARHVDGLKLENVSFTLEPGTFDRRDALVLDDVERDEVASVAECGETLQASVGDQVRPRICGEKTVFHVRASSNVTVKIWADNCGTKKALPEKMVGLTVGHPVDLEATLDEPGFLRLHLKTADGKLSKTVTVAYEPEKIEPALPRPTDFDAYWRGELERLERDVPLDPRMELITERSSTVSSEYALSFATFNGKRVYGFVTIPKKATAANRMGLRITVPGAGQAACRTWDVSSGQIVATLNALPYKPGNDEAEQGRIYADYLKEIRDKFGVSSYPALGWDRGRDEVFFHDAIVGIVRAIDWLRKLPEVNPDRVTYFGGSQGGGLGIATVALAGGFHRAYFYITALSDLHGADAGRVDGWPSRKSRGFDRLSSEGRRAACAAAPYYDACNFAECITCPVHSSLGLEDMTCYPPNVQASFNCLSSSDKRMTFDPDTGHGIRGETLTAAYEWLRGD